MYYLLSHSTDLATVCAAILLTANTGAAADPITQKWGYAVQYPAFHAPALGADGNILVGASEWLYALDNSGNAIWTNHLNPARRPLHKRQFMTQNNSLESIARGQRAC